MNVPPVLPSPDAVIRLSALTSMWNQLVTPSAKAYAVFEVMYDSAGAKQRMRVVEAEMDSVGLQKVSALFRSDLSGESPSRARSWGALVRVESRDGEPEVSVGRMEYCPCALTNRAEFTRMVTQFVRETRPGVTGRREVTIQVRSDSTGAILEKKLGQSTGNLQLDRLIYDLADAMKVAPALLNRRPINGWSELPIVLNFPAQR